MVTITGLDTRDIPTITATELEADLFGRQVIGLKYADQAVGQTEKAIRFSDISSNGRQISFWVPKAACVAVNYLSPDGRMTGAVRFHSRYLPRR